MQAFFDVYSILLIVTLITGLVMLKRLTSPFRILVLMVGYVLVSEMISRTLVITDWGKSAPVYHVTSCVLIILTGLVYYHLPVLSAAKKRLILIISVVCLVIALLNTLLYQDISTFPSFSIVSHAFQSVFLALLIFNEMMKTPAKVSLLKQGLFWMNAGTLLCYSFNFVGFTFYNQIFQSEIFISWWYYVNWSGNIVLYGSYLVAFYLNQREKDEQ